MYWEGGEQFTLLHPVSGSRSSDGSGHGAWKNLPSAPPGERREAAKMMKERRRRRVRSDHRDFCLPSFLPSVARSPRSTSAANDHFREDNLPMSAADPTPQTSDSTHVLQSGREYNWNDPAKICLGHRSARPTATNGRGPTGIENQ